MTTTTMTHGSERGSTRTASDDCESDVQRLRSLAMQSNESVVILKLPNAATFWKTREIIAIPLDVYQSSLQTNVKGIETLGHLVSAVTGVPLEEIRSNRKARPVVRARQALMLLAHESGLYSYPDIRDYLRLYSHSSVGEAVKNPPAEAAAIASRARECVTRLTRTESA